RWLRGRRRRSARLACGAARRRRVCRTTWGSSGALQPRGGLDGQPGEGVEPGGAAGAVGEIGEVELGDAERGELGRGLDAPADVPVVVGVVGDDVPGVQVTGGADDHDDLPRIARATARAWWTMRQARSPHGS